MDYESWARQRAMHLALSNVVASAELRPPLPHGVVAGTAVPPAAPLPGLSGISAKICTVLLFLFVAAWPFAPILVHWKPWASQPTLAFLLLLLTLAWVLVARSHSIFAALLSSWLTLALTGLTAWEYTTEQVRLHQ
ncbi:unnamed protein product [Ascophyllum nodosum]